MLRLLPILFVVILLVSLMTYSPVPIREEDTTTSCCTMEDVLAATGEFDYSDEKAVFNSEEVNYPKEQLVQALSHQNLSTAVLGTTNTAGIEKWIEVSLDDQKVRAWEGNSLVKEFLISSGKWAPTPKGTFNIWYKTRSQKMSGGSRALNTYYYLPNVPHNMFFKGPYALHGAYWHTNFGTPMSHGCVNEPLAEAAWIFDWAGPVVPEGKNVVKADASNPGTRVWVH